MPLRQPNDLDGTLNETATDKIRQYRADYNHSNRPSNVISFMTVITSTSDAYIVNLYTIYFYRIIWKLTIFLQI